MCWRTAAQTTDLRVPHTTTFYSRLLKNSRCPFDATEEALITHHVAAMLMTASSRIDLPHAPGGGANRDRTGDLLLAKQALSQLSYGPRAGVASQELVGLDGFEPSTPALSRRCSNQLSYRPAWVACDLRCSMKNSR